MPGAEVFVTALTRSVSFYGEVRDGDVMAASRRGQSVPGAEVFVTALTCSVSFYGDVRGDAVGAAIDRPDS